MKHTKHRYHIRITTTSHNLLEQAYILALPAPYLYIPWQPWLKGYHGETMIGGLTSMFDFAKYVWIDEDLKYEMTGRR